MKWCEDAQKRLKKYGKKWMHEVVNVSDNLGTLIDALDEGAKPEQLKKLGFVRSEPSGILAIDESGPGKGSKMKALRLLVFPHEEKQDLYVMTLGDKDSESDDIRLCKVFVAGLQSQAPANTARRAQVTEDCPKPVNDQDKG
ncbi:MAG: Uncharacterized protein FD138_4106 [Planctomycetota bacterium]|nr:MAG: Uncharacterized protein FD138_4106 [Planctomycetota bacterium]